MPLFWDVWWCTALGNLGVQHDGDAPPEVLADAPRRIDCLCDAVRELYDGPCLKELDNWLSEEEESDEEPSRWMDSTPGFQHAVACLGLDAYVELERVRYAALRASSKTQIKEGQHVLEDGHK